MQGADGGGARVRKQRDTTSRYGAGVFAVMEASSVGALMMESRRHTLPRWMAFGPLCV